MVSGFCLVVYCPDCLLDPVCCLDSLDSHLSATITQCLSDLDTIPLLQGMLDISHFIRNYISPVLSTAQLLDNLEEHTAHICRVFLSEKGREWTTA
jgi:hypothetical protein